MMLAKWHDPTRSSHDMRHFGLVLTCYSLHATLEFGLLSCFSLLMLTMLSRYAALQPRPGSYGLQPREGGPRRCCLFHLRACLDVCLICAS